MKKAYHKNSDRKRYDVSRLKNEIQKEYCDRLRSCLRNSPCTGVTSDVEHILNTIKDGFCEAAESILKFQELNKKVWITEETWECVVEREKLKAKQLNSRIFERTQKDNDPKNRKNKKNARRDKRAFANQFAKEAEEAATSRYKNALYKITQRLRGLGHKFFKSALSSESKCTQLLKTWRSALTHQRSKG